MASPGTTPVAILTPKQREIVERTWKIVEEDPDGLYGVGVEMFKNMFTICPEAQKLFKSFAEVPLDKLAEVKEFGDHALQVTEAISLAVSALDDLDTLGLIMRDVGQAHSPNRLKDIHFDAMCTALIMTLEEGLGESFTKEAKEAFSTFFGMVASHMKDGLDSEPCHPWLLLNQPPPERKRLREEMERKFQKK